MANSSPVKVLFMTLLFLGLASVEGSHFRGGLMWWRPETQNSTEVQISYRIGWRRSYSGVTFCDDSTITENRLIGNLETMTCFSGCSGNIDRMSFYCTDYSEAEDWTTGSRSISYTFPSNDVFQIGYSGSDWIGGLKRGGGSWEVRMTVNLTRRGDTGRLNFSPITNMPPIVRLQDNCNHTLTIPVDDPDNDEVRCRWAQASKRECGGVCEAFVGAVLNEKDCKITFEADSSVGLYAAALMIEDFSEPGSDVPLSAIPLQFLINVFTGDGNCTSQPEFTSLTRADGSCVGVPFNSTYHEPIVIRTFQETSSISDVKTVSPRGLTKSNPPVPLPDSAGLFYVNITWEPRTEQEGPNIFCFSAIDNSGQSTEQRCITLLGGVTPPVADVTSLWPQGDILPTQKEWKVTFDLEFVRATSTRHVRFFEEATGTEAVRVDATDTRNFILPADTTMNKTVVLKTGYRFIEKRHYIVQLDPGIVKGTSYCGAESRPLRGPSWRVRIRDITPPVVTFLDPDRRTNGDIRLVWRIDESAFTECTLNSITMVDRFSCTNEWTVSNQTEGVYTLYVVATDLEGNVGLRVGHTWTVDRTPPAASFDRVPTSITNRTSFTFTFTCDESCTYRCSLTSDGTLAYTDCSRNSFSTRTLIDNQVFRFSVIATDDVGNLAEAINYDFETDFQPPTFSNISDLNVPCGSDISVDVLGTPTITDNRDLAPTLIHQDTPGTTCDVIRRWTARDKAGNEATLDQTILFTNPSEPEVRIAPNTVIPCGTASTISSSEYLTSTVTVNHPCDRSINIDFTDSTDTIRCGSTFQRTWRITDDCGAVVIRVQQVRVLELQFPEAPQSGQVNVERRPELRWTQYPNAYQYRLFVWELGQTKPGVPTAVTSNRRYLPSGYLRPGTRILWQVEYVTGENETVPSPIWGFETKKYPDFLIAEIVTPPTAFSGQTLEVSWLVENVGNATSAATSWLDVVYISPTSDIRDGRQTNRVFQNNILLPRDGYRATATIRLLKNEIGMYYVFIRTDYRRQVEDIDRTNNERRSKDRIEVKLTPPPDLRVDDLTHLTSSFSGQDLIVRWSVKNYGTGKTDVARWSDAVYWSSDNSSDTGDLLLHIGPHTGALEPTQEYANSATVKVPRKVFGDFFIIIVTDFRHEVYEHINEENNIGISEIPITVTLTPPPDLEVLELQSESSFTTGDQMAITWTVINAGQRAPYVTSWRDRIELMHKVTGESTILQDTYFSGILSPGATYSQTVNPVVQVNLGEGDYDLSVTVDFTSEVFEFTSRDNNIMRKTIFIKQALPDLRLINIITNVTQVDNSAVVTIQWQGNNTGEGAVLAAAWIDQFSLVSTNGLVRFLVDAPVTRKSYLLPASSYVSQVAVTIPNAIYGTWRVRGVVDGSRLTADMDYNNNVLISAAIRIPKLLPNLKVTLLERTDDFEAYGGQQIVVKWSVTNDGTASILSKSWTDVILLGKEADDLAGAVLLHMETIENDLGQTEWYTRETFITIPENIVGAVFVIISVNHGGKLLEGEAIGDNQRSLSIDVQTPPTPDLTVTSVTATHIEGQRLVEISWEVTNQGNSMFRSERWSDCIYLQPASGGRQVYLGSFEAEARLSAGKSIGFSRIVPVGKITSPSTVTVHVDCQNNVTEINGESNNMASTKDALPIPVIPSSMLVASFLQLTPNSPKMGQQAELSYSVANDGDGGTFVTSWTDGIYIFGESGASVGDVLESGIKVAELPHIGSLEPTQSYLRNVLYLVPFGIYQQTIYIIPDINGVLQDATVAGKHSLSVQEGDLPNLKAVFSGQVLSSRGGQPFMFQYNITNTGPGVPFGPWFDSVFLSLDIVIDPFDRKLGTFERAMNVASNSSEVMLVEAFLPFDLPSGSYYIIVSVDSRDDIYEADEFDNEAYHLITLEEAVSTDIAVSHVSAPPSANVLEDVTITWTLLNNGSLEATGYRCDSVYLSRDTDWDINDFRVGDPSCGFLRISPADTLPDGQSYSLTATVPFVKQESYNTLVKTRTNVIDFKLDNNVGVAASQLGVTIEPLTLDAEVVTQLGRGKVLAYKIPDVLSDESLLVFVTSNQRDDVNNIYVKFAEGVSKYDYDFTSTSPNLPDQTVIVPFTRSGDYYVLVEGTATLSPGSTPPSEVRILAKLAKFEIMNTTPKTVSGLGNVTLKIEGTRFPYDVTAILVAKNSSEIRPLDIFRFSSTLVYATFDLTGQTVGTTFDLRLQNTVTDVRTPEERDALRVILGVRGKVDMKLERPRALRQGETAVVTLDVQNIGDTDVAVPIIHTTLSDGAEMQLSSVVDSDVYETEMAIIASPTEGPGGILPPGSSSRIQVKVRRSDPSSTGRSTIRFHIMDNDETPHLYAEQNDVYRYQEYTNETWNRVWENHLNFVGRTKKSFYHAISRYLNALSVLRKRVYRLRNLIQTSLEMADGVLLDTVLATATDLKFINNVDSPDLLQFRRYFSARVGMRTTTGSLGKGWISPFWDSRIANVSVEVIILSHEHILYPFVIEEYGSYVNPSLGILDFQDSGFYLTIGKEEYHYSFDTGKLLTVTNLIDENRMTLEYNAKGFPQIVSDQKDGRLQITYDDMNRISSTTVLEGNRALSTALYVYDEDNRLLSVTVDGETTRYSYSEDDFLTQIMKPSGERQEFAYTDEGLILRKRVTGISGELVAERSYTYHGLGAVTVDEDPEQSSLTYTYDDNKQVVGLRRIGFPPFSWTRTTHSMTTFEGDNIVTKEEYIAEDDMYVIEDGNRDGIGFVYTEDGSLQKFTNGNGKEYLFEYNEAGKRTQISYPDGRLDRYSYDDSGKVDAITARSGSRLFFEFNQKGQILQELTESGERTSFIYDRAGQLTSAINPTGSITTTYSGDRPSRVEYSNGKYLEYSFSDRGIRTGITGSDGYEITYAYDGQNRLTSARSGPNNLLSVQYNSRGLIQRKTLGNGAYTEFVYDPRSSYLLSMKNFYPDGSLESQFEYRYDTSNRRISLITSNGEWFFRYDPAGQLTYVKRPDGTETVYVYDKQRNRVSKSVNDNKKLYSTNNMDQYTEFGTQSFEHDLNGNLILKEENGKNVSFTFDDKNRLTGAQTSRTACAYTYDAKGLLFKKICDSKETLFLMDSYGPNGAQLLAEYPTGESAKFYYSADNLGLIAMQTSGSLYYYHFDPIGSVVAILNDNGERLNSYEYEPFGAIVSSTEKLQNSFKYIGQLGILSLGLDDTADVYFMRARCYDSEHGRFFSLDPIGFRGHSRNLYAYSDNNPVHFSDPRGTILPILVVIGGRALLGGAINLAGWAVVNALTPGSDWSGATGAFVEGAITGALIPGIPTTGATGAISQALKKIATKIGPKIISSIKNTALPAAKKALGKIGSAIRTALNSKTVASARQALSKLGSKLTDALKTTGQKLTNAGRKAVDAIKQTIQKALGSPALSNTLSKVKNVIKDLAGKAKKFLRTDLGATLAGGFGGTLVQEVIDNIRSGDPIEWQKFATSALAGLGTLKVGDATLQSIASNALNTILNERKKIYEKAKEVGKWAKDFAIEQAKNIRDKAQMMYNKAKDLVEKASDKAKEVARDLADKAKQMVEKGKEMYERAKEKFIEKGKEAFEKGKELYDKAKEGLKDIAEKVRDKASDLYDDLGDLAKDAKDLAKDTWDDVKDYVEDVGEKIADKLEDLGEDVGDWLNDKLDDIGDAWDDFWDDDDHDDDRNSEEDLDWIRSVDPNDIIGPSGYGDAHFVPKSLRLEYKIRFENSENATAPAQRVLVQTRLDPDLDPRTLRVGDFGFGEFTLNIPMDKSFFQETIDLKEINGIFVRARGGIDIVKGEVTWELLTIDPDTGDQPDDPSKGFLPPNNGTTGQGFVTYSILPKRQADTLARIDAEAKIFFDMNEPIDTPPIFNTLDDSFPRTNLSKAGENVTSGAFGLALSSEDVGAGVKSIDIYLVQGNDIQVIRPSVGFLDRVVLLSLPQEVTYTFMALPSDFVGNREPLDEALRTQTVDIFYPKLNFSCDGGDNCSGNGICIASNTCLCSAGFYGDDCSRNIPPLEPPVVEIQVEDGVEGDSVKLFVNSRAVKNTSSPIELRISGFPNGSVFENDRNPKMGVIESVDNLNITFRPPAGFSGTISLLVSGTINEGGETAGRDSQATIQIIAVADTPFLSVDPVCYRNTSDGNMNLTLDIVAESTDPDGSEMTMVQLQGLPESFSLSQGTQVDTDTYDIPSDRLEKLFVIIPEGEPFMELNLTITAISTETSNGQRSETSASLSVKVCEEEIPTTTVFIPTTTINAGTTNGTTNGTNISTRNQPPSGGLWSSIVLALVLSMVLSMLDA